MMGNYFYLFLVIKRKRHIRFISPEPGEKYVYVIVKINMKLIFKI